MWFDCYSGANTGCSRVGSVYLTYLQTIQWVLWAKAVKELMAKLKKRMTSFFSLEKTIGHCLKITKEKRFAGVGYL